MAIVKMSKVAYLLDSERDNLLHELRAGMFTLLILKRMKFS